MGKVRSIDLQAGTALPSFDGRRVRFDVVEAFRGVTRSEVEVFTGSGGGDCGYSFQIGGSHLVYAYQSPGSPRLSTGICSRTRPLAQAADDLAYMRGLPGTGALGATITGSVHHRDRNISKQPGVTILALVASAGVVMDCQGAAYRATTDAGGRFTIAGVPVGSCTPRLELPASDFLFFSREISIPDPPACAEVDVMVGTRRPPP